MALLITDYSDSLALNTTYFLINMILFVHEILQAMAYGIEEYLKDFGNLIDLVRLFVCVAWLVVNSLHSNLSTLTWIMVLLNFIKGIIGFRAFDNTRFYVRLIYTAFKDTYSFIFLFSYSTVAFGVLYYASSPNNHHSLFRIFWQTPFDLSLGNYQHSDYFSLDYLFFLLAAIVNIIMMLNLLIAILGDSYDKFRIASIEINYKEMIEVILEIESIFPWKRNVSDKFFIHVCEVASKKGVEDEWEGKVKIIEQKIDQISKKVGDECRGMGENFEMRMKFMEERFAKLINHKFDELKKSMKPS